jgi:hypothetical protein
MMIYYVGRFMKRGGVREDEQRSSRHSRRFKREVNAPSFSRLVSGKSK